MTYYKKLVYIFIPAVIAILAGCKTPQQLIDKANEKDPEAVAKYTRDKYPCTDLLRPDTAVIFRDTTVYVDCPDTAQITPFEVTVTDTVNKVVTKTIRVPVTIRVPGTTVTRYYEDSAKIKLAYLQVQGLQADTATLHKQVTKYQGRSERRGKENWIWRAIAISLIIWTLFRFWNKITTFKLR